MFKQIVVGVDEHEGGRDAVALAKNLLGPDGELTLAYVYPADSFVHWSAHAALDASEREQASELLEKTRAEAGVHARLASRRSSSVGRGLHELAESIKADLLVVGSSRRSLLGRVLIGDDTRAALNGAPCSIAIAPASYSKQTVAIREIGVAYDGSPESEHAVAVARELATDRDATLSAFEAVSLPTYAFVGVGAPIDDALQSLVDAARERIAALGGVEPHAAYGQPAEELAVYSASVDLLVVGSRGYGPMGRLIHGSTSRQLLRAARCPLLVLTRASRAIGPEEDRETAAAMKA
jgi:nucleotide-binding universal stress UspA family protein